MLARTPIILIEGWRFLPHSYAVVNQFQCLELLRRPDVQVRHRDAPLYNPNWRTTVGLFEPPDEAILRAVPQAAPNQPADALYRIAFPYNFAPSPIARKVVFGTAEYRIVPDNSIAGGIGSHAALTNPEFTIVTPSEWSRQGFILSGADPSRVAVVPHGVDTRIFKPVSPEMRAAIRRQLGWRGFVFLHIGAMTRNKGLSLLIKALSILAQDYPDIMLVLKGNDALYPSRDFFMCTTGVLTQSELRLFEPRVRYNGQSMSFALMAQLYQAADAYVSPYLAEGFNLPVLEAIACGLPVICTKGGATDDFTPESCVLHIQSRIEKADEVSGGVRLAPSFEQLLTHMRTLVTSSETAARARQYGPAYVEDGFTWARVTDRMIRLLAE